MNKKNVIKSILKDKQKRAILILAIYFIFFLIITIYIRNNYSPIEDDTADIINNQVSNDQINLNNYNFKYLVMHNNVLNTYEGKRYNNKELFVFNGNEYFKEDDKFYKKIVNENNENSYEEIENPYVYSEYLDFTNLNKILEKSEYNATTNFKDGSLAKSYFMYLDGVLTENIITLKTKDDILQQIEINIGRDYIVLEFSNQNEIEDFNK